MSTPSVSTLAPFGLPRLPLLHVGQVVRLKKTEEALARCVVAVDEIELHSSEVVSVDRLLLGIEAEDALECLTLLFQARIEAHGGAHSLLLNVVHHILLGTQDLNWLALLLGDRFFLLLRWFKLLVFDLLILLLL